MSKNLEFLNNRSKRLTRVVKIDEEGYPLSSGLRIDDEQIVFEILSNIKRSLTENPKSLLVTSFGGKWARLESFSSPLIVQSVEQKTDTDFKAFFLAGHYVQFKLQDLEIDEWDRLHFYSVQNESQIEVTFSRKAQTQLLKLIDEEIHFKEFRYSDPSVSTSKRWSGAYQSQDTGWELGSLSPSVQELVSDVDLKGKKVLVPGAGRGHEVNFLTKLGAEVVAEDFSPEAKKDFHSLYPDSKAQYLVEDFFRSEVQEAEFDFVLEFIFYCAIEPKRRSEYWNQIKKRLKSGGSLLGIFLMHHAPGGPPFSTTQWELKSLVDRDFSPNKWRVSSESVMPRLGSELELQLKKK